MTIFESTAYKYQCEDEMLNGIFESCTVFFFLFFRKSFEYVMFLKVFPSDFTSKMKGIKNTSQDMTQYLC